MPQHNDIVGLNCECNITSSVTCCHDQEFEYINGGGHNIVNDHDHNNDNKRGDNDDRGGDDECDDNIYDYDNRREHSHHSHHSRNHNRTYALNVEDHHRQKFGADYHWKQPSINCS